MSRFLSRVGLGLAKILSIELDNTNEVADQIIRSQPLFSSHTANAYIEEEPHVADWLWEKVPSGAQLHHYFYSMFPFTRWIPNYNLQWLLGITTGVVVVPQGMAYSILAGLPPQYGLYTSFMGVSVYWLFASSKDITIGPVAVISILIGNVVFKARESNPEIPSPVIASAMTMFCGGVILFIGLMRCGWIIEMIPHLSISAFLTGSAINIATGQLPGLMGIGGFDTRAPTYEVLLNTLKNLTRMELDAVLGLSALFLLYVLRWGLAFIGNKFPSKKKLFFFLLTLRTVFVIFLYTMISWLVNRHHRERPLFKILSSVPAGLTAAGVPVINKSIISIFISQVPIAVVVIMIEHIAVGKSHGRINNYTINPSQEMIAVGITNILGPFLGGYAATGSFSRTAINSKANVRTPLSGVITAVVVLTALYALPAVFFYIPSSALCAVIIHAVMDLITPPNMVYQFWRVSPPEAPIFFAGVFVTIFSSIENGIYTTILASAVLLIVRFINANGKFLGKVEVYPTTSDSQLNDDSKRLRLLSGSHNSKAIATTPNEIFYSIFPPLDHSDGTNPEILIQPPKPGIFIYRFGENFNYPSANHYLEQFTQYILANTRRPKQVSYARPGDRPWNDTVARKTCESSQLGLPILKAVIFDFSAVNFVDTTSIQKLIDARNQLDQYASPNVVNWHFSNINNLWTKRALVNAGFGYPSMPADELHHWKSVVNITKIAEPQSCAQASEIISHDPNMEQDSSSCDVAKNNISTDRAVDCELDIVSGPPVAFLRGINRPLFHSDLASAWLSAILNSNKEQHGNDKPATVGDNDTP